MDKKSLGQNANKIIQDYKMLLLGGKSVVCPYYINPKTTRANLRVLIGKGNPEEITLETEICAKLGGLDLNSMSEDEIRKFMIKRHIGIDCSGFVVHVLNEETKEKFNKKLWSVIKKKNKNIYSSIRYFLRPVENIGVADLTSEINSYQIKNVNEVKVGDIIKMPSLKNEHGLHVLLINELEVEENQIKTIKFANSNRYYGDDNGIRFGEIKVIDDNKGLEQQQWIDPGSQGDNYTYESYIKDLSVSGIYRLNIFK